MSHSSEGYAPITQCNAVSPIVMVSCMSMEFASRIVLNVVIHFVTIWLLKMVAAWHIDVLGSEKLIGGRRRGFIAWE